MIVETMVTTTRRLPATLGPHYAFGYEGNLILKSAVVDLEKREVTLPLHRGRLEDGRTVWHVITDASDEDVAHAMGIIYSPKLANAGGRAIRAARYGKDGTLVFDRGAVDFSPERMLLPGDAPDYFPPKLAHAGSVAAGSEPGLRGGARKMRLVPRSSCRMDDRGTREQ
jgi:hypothetical protein